MHLAHPFGYQRSEYARWLVVVNLSREGEVKTRARRTLLHALEFLGHGLRPLNLSTPPATSTAQARVAKTLY